MSNSPNLTAAYLDANQAQPHVTVNAAIARIDSIVGGMLTKTLTGTATTLSDAETAVRVMKFNGTPGGASTVNISAATGAGRVWYVHNNTNQTVTVKVTGLTGIAIATTKRRILYCDGTDIFAMGADY